MFNAVLHPKRVPSPVRALAAWLRVHRRARARRQRVALLATRIQWLETTLPREEEYSSDARYCSRGYELLERGSSLWVRWSERPSPLLDGALRQWHSDFERLHPQL
ncbi:hypothetical protein KUV89_16440 [Marinobacter hydrocarbonoclasticus]|nr:hypothetical protein [Marinobacter nauticus]